MSTEWIATGSSHFQGVTVRDEKLAGDGSTYRASIIEVREVSLLSPREARERLAARLQRIAQELLR